MNIHSDPATPPCRLPILFAIPAFILLLPTMGQVFNFGNFLLGFAYLMQIPIAIRLIQLMPQKTAVGNNLWMQVRGLKQSINYGKWREIIKEKNLFIEEVLPFAVSLGVIDRLAKDMKDLDIEPPDYFHAGASGSLSQDFVSQFNNDMNSSIAYNPSSSSSGGSFSGGGGGGGGGGSW